MDYSRGEKALDRSKYASYEPWDLGQVHPSLTLFPCLSLRSRSWHMPCTLHRCNEMTSEGKDMKRALQIMEKNASPWWGLLSDWVLKSLKYYVKEGTQLNMLRNQGGTLGEGSTSGRISAPWNYEVWSLTGPFYTGLLFEVYDLLCVTELLKDYSEHPSPPCWCNQTRFTLHSQSSWLTFSSVIQLKHLGLVNIQGLHSDISQWLRD